MTFFSETVLVSHGNFQASNAINYNSTSIYRLESHSIHYVLIIFKRAGDRRGGREQSSFSTEKCL